MKEISAEISGESGWPGNFDNPPAHGHNRKERTGLPSFRFRLAVAVAAAVLMAVIASAPAAKLFVPGGWAQARGLSGEEILKRVDDNITAGNKVMTARMIIHLRRASRTVEFKSYVQGTEKAFTEYLAPPRERGTKMLKLGNQLWMYSPWTERTILISGHMLRQSVMGSDLSYEDMMEDPRLLNSYGAEVVGEETIRLGEGFKAGKSGPGTSAEKDSGARAAQPAGQAEEAEQRGLEEKKEREAEKEPKAAPSRPQSKISGSVIEEGSEVKCWVLELAARQEDVAYPRRKLWVDRERFVVVRAELYARGGTLLKKVEVLSLRKFGWRWVPVRAIFKDMLKAGEGTEFLIDSIEFEARIPDYIFTRAALK